MASYRSPDSISDHIFHTPFPLKTIPVFRSGLYEIITSLLWLECQQKGFLKSIRIRILLFLSYSCWIETANTFIHYRSRSSIESHSRFPEQNGAKTIPFGMGRDIALWLIKGSTPRHPRWGQCGAGCILKKRCKSSSTQTHNITAKPDLHSPPSQN